MPSKVFEALVYLTADEKVAKTPDEAAFVRHVIHFDDGSSVSNTLFVVEGKVEKSQQVPTNFGAVEKAIKGDN